MDKKLLVTGGAGYVGSHVVHYLINDAEYRPQDIIVFDSLLSGHAEVLPEDVILVEGDLRNKEDINDVFKIFDIDGVIHLAGVLNVAESMTEPAIYFEANVLGGVNLLAAMQAGNCRKIVFSSSCTVYGEAASPVTEEMVTEPISPYGESKLQFERWLDWYAKIHQFQAVSLRYFNAAGAAYDIGEWHEPEIHLIPSVLWAATKGVPVTIYGNDYDTPDGTCVRDYVHVRDLAAAHVRALEYLSEFGSDFYAFNLGNGLGTSVLEIVRMVENVTGKPVAITYALRRPGDAPQMFADVSKAVAELGWRPASTTEDCIRDAWEWFRKRQAPNSEQLE